MIINRGAKMARIYPKKIMKEVIMIYSKDQADRQVSQRSSVQQKLWELFDLM